MTLRLEIPILKPRDKPGAEEGGSPRSVSQHDLYCKFQAGQGYKVRSWGILWKRPWPARHCPFSFNCKISKHFTNTTEWRSSDKISLILYCPLLVSRAQSLKNEQIKVQYLRKMNICLGAAGYLAM